MMIKPSPPPKPPLVLRLLQAVQSCLVEEERLPFEAGSSYPLPASLSNKQQLCGFHILPEWKNSEITGYWVISRFIVDYGESLVVNKFDCVSESKSLFMGLPQKIVPATPPSETDPATREELEAALFSSFEKVLEAFYTQQPAKHLAKKYWRLIMQLSPPALIPYYEALNPGFFQWVSK
jgi:hypothetical protein